MPRRLEESHVVHGDAVEVLQGFATGSVDLVLTSPPYYGHRDYGVEGQIGGEANRESYLAGIGEVLAELRRVVADHGACFVVIGDTYRHQRLQLIPHRMVLLADELGWVVRNDLIWHKLDPPPESPRNRWRSGHEHILFLTKRASKYRFDPDAIRVPYAESTLRRWGKGQTYGGNKSEQRAHDNDSRMRHGKSFRLHPKGCLPIDVWSMPSGDSPVRHYATFPERLVQPIIEACTAPDQLVFDPFAGSGTTCRVAVRLGRRSVGVELNPEYAALANRSIREAMDSA